jgi:hypothetical protein
LRWDKCSKSIFTLIRINRLQRTSNPYIRLWFSIYLSINMSVYLSTYVSVYLSTYMSVYLSTYMSVYLSTYMSVNLSILMSVYLSFCLLPFTLLSHIKLEWEDLCGAGPALIRQI